MLKDLDGVVLLEDFPQDGVFAGEIGTVIIVHGDPVEAYEVEFVSSDGKTVAILVVRPSQIRKLTK